MQIKQLKQSLPYLLKSGLVPLIIGRHGIGKSQTIKQFCVENGYNMVDVRLGQMSDAGDILGLPDFIRDDSGQAQATKFMRPSWLPTKPRTIIFLDEVNRAHKDIMQAIFQLVLDKKVHEYNLPEECYVIAAANPNTEEYDTYDFIFTEQALVDRFVHIKLEPSVDEFLDYASDKKMTPSLLAFLREHGNKHIHTYVDKFSLDYIKSSNRSLIAADTLEKTGMPEELLKECLFGILGTETTLQYMEHRKNNMNKIAASDVLNNFAKVKPIVTKFSSTDENRNDVLKVTCDELKDLLKDLEKLETAQVANVKEFYATIPKDLATASLLDMLSSSIKCIAQEPSIVEDDAFINLF